MTPQSKRYGARRLAIIEATQDAYYEALNDMPVADLKAEGGMFDTREKFIEFLLKRSDRLDSPEDQVCVARYRVVKWLIPPIERAFMIIDADGYERFVDWFNHTDDSHCLQLSQQFDGVVDACLDNGYIFKSDRMEINRLQSLAWQVVKLRSQLVKVYGSMDKPEGNSHARMYYWLDQNRALDAGWSGKRHDKHYQ